VRAGLQTELQPSPSRPTPRDAELTTVNVETGKSTMLGAFVGDVTWTRRGIYAYEPNLER
jgi:hypothetical protein